MKGRLVKRLIAMTLSAAMILTGTVNTVVFAKPVAEEEIQIEELSEDELVEEAVSDEESKKDDKKEEKSADDESEASVDEESVNEGESDAWNGTKSTWTNTEVGASTYKFQTSPSTGYMLGIYVDTTATGSKYVGQGSFAQVNTGTKIYVPVVDDSYYTFTTGAYHNGKTNVYKVQTSDGIFTEEGETGFSASRSSTEGYSKSFICKPVYSDERERYEILVEMTQNDYLYGYKIEAIELADDDAEDCEAVFKNGDELPKGINLVDFDTTNSAGHGYKSNSTSSKMYINIKEGKKANIIIDGCEYGTATAITSNVGSVENNIPQVNGKTVSQWTIAGAEGLTALFFNSGMFVHGIRIEYLADTTYSINVKSNNKEFGTVSANLSEARNGEEVTLTVKPVEGYELKGYEVKDDVVTISNNKFVMPGEAVEITAVFVQKERYNITVTVSGDGIASADCVSAYDGKEVTLTQKASENNIFKGWIVKDDAVTVKGSKFTMTNKAVEIIAVFEKANDENSTVKEGPHPFDSPVIAAGEFDVQGVSLDGIDGVGNSHGIYTDKDNGGKMILNLKKKANITVTTCCFTAGTGATITSSSGSVDKSEWVETGDKKGLKFVILGAAAGKVVLDISANTYIHSMDLEYINEIGKRTAIDVWDFGGYVESDEKYINNITPENMISNKFAVVKGTLAGGSFEFGDLTAVVAAGDRLYTNVEELSEYNCGTYGFAQTEYDKSYTSKGAWYSNGSGGPTRRYVTIKDVQAGDKIVTYMGIAQNGPSEMYFEGQGGASGQKDKIEAKAGEFKRSEFVAQKNGTYKIYESNTGKPMYHRIMRYPYVDVTGTIDFGDYKGTEHTVKFINLATEVETEAVVSGSNFTAHLAPGYNYLAVLSGAKGYGFTIASNKVNTTDEESLTGKSGVKLVVEEKSQFKYAGKINGFAEGYDVSKLKLTFVPVQAGIADKANVVITGSDFEVTLLDSVEYRIEMTGVNDYELVDDVVVKTTKDVTDAKINVATKAVYTASGKFFGNDEVMPSALSFENVEDGYTYAAEIKDGGYSIKLRDGSYQAKVTIEGHRTETHVVVNGADVSKDIMFVSTAAKEKIEKVSDIYVGYPNKENNYATVRDAMEACSLMDPQPSSEADRITVHIAPGTYREQIFVTTPYVSFVNDSSEDVLLTWYYGIGYKYYSSDDYYNPEKAYDKFGKKIAAKWGTAVYVKNTAKYFRADGIIFENSFNRYVTKEEIEDGVECDTLKIERSSLDSKSVQGKAATERATALVIEAPYGEFTNCSFYSSQDTLYTAETGYFKNCYIEGQTDYIFGSGNVVFDTCNLGWKGYSSNSMGGYITANRPDSEKEVGYLFRNCVVTGNKNNIITVSPGYYGRPWGPLAKVKFINTKLENAGLIEKAGWYEMSGVNPEDVTFLEYNTTTLLGEAVDTAGRVKGKNAGVMTKEQAEAINVKDYFADKNGTSWNPVAFKEEAAELKFVTNPFISDNGDLNTPYPGHTLTVGYSLGEANDANDVSTIEWYTVKDGKDTLVKTSSAVNDKTYKITKNDVGSLIKVVVKPVLISGRTADAKSSVTVSVVLDGYEDPSNPGADPTLGEGINVFLAGDSTVKDYSASGINSGGSARDEGAWGEFLQYFLNDQATVLNYANGGRSSRSFINDGSLAKIESKIGEGDYLFIQFGHNDCANDKGYIDERFCPLGTPDAKGVYPVTEGKKVPTPEALKNLKYGSECYTYDCGGTYKWYLLQYINVARKAGATPVLVTPVARMYYTADGKIKPHHDQQYIGDEKNTNMTNTYVEAVKQLGKEENVLVIDGYELTKNLFEKAYKDGGNNTYGAQIMNKGETTHSNKLGGFISAMLMAEAIYDVKASNPDFVLSNAVKLPSEVKGNTASGQLVVSFSGGKLEAYDITTDYKSHAEYWEKTGSEMLKAYGEKINSENPGQDPEGPGQDPEDPGKDPSEGEVSENNLKIIGENSELVAEKGYITDKNSQGDIKTSLAVDSKGNVVDTVSLIVSYAKGKATTVKPADNKGEFTVNAGSKITLPGVDPLNKLQAYNVVTTTGVSVNTAETKLKDKNFAIKKGVITTKANKNLPKYSFEVSYVVGEESYSYKVNVLNIGFKKDYKKTSLKAKEYDGTADTQTVISLDGDLLQNNENTITSTIWMVGKNTILVPGKETEIKNNKNLVFAKVTLAADGKTVTVKTTGVKDANSKPVAGAVNITALTLNGKKIKTSVKVKK